MADLSSSTVFDNWISRMNLICSNQNNHALMISMFGTSMLLGFMVGSMTLTNLSDIYGRKPLILVSLMLSTVIAIPIIFLQDNYVGTLICSFLFGISASSRYSIAYIYSVELSTSTNCAFFGTFCMLGDSLSSIWIGFYFWVFKSMDVALWVVIGIQLVCALLIHMFVPESPHFLLYKGSKGRFMQCIKNISKVNGTSDAVNFI